MSMTDKTKEILETYEEELNNLSVAVGEELAALEIKKNSDEEKLTAKEEKKYQKLQKIDKRIVAMVAREILFADYNSVLDALDILQNNDLSEEEIKKNVDIVVKCFESSQSYLDDMLKEINLTDEEVANLEATKNDFERELKKINREYRFYDKKEAKEANAKQKEINSKLEVIDEYFDSKETYEEIINKLNSLDNNTSEEERDCLIDTCYHMFENEYNETYAKVVVDMDKLKSLKKEFNKYKTQQPKKDDQEPEKKDKEELKRKTAELNRKLSETLAKHKKTLIAIGGVALALGVIIFTANKCSQDKGEALDSTSYSDSDNLNPEEPQPVVNPIAEKLVNMGYRKDKAYKMANNFSEKALNAILNDYYRPEVENYAEVKDYEFIYEYLDDYENAYNIYNLTNNKAVDYVNRSYEIKKTNFFPEYAINNIVEVVMAIDEKELFTSENGNLAQSFNTTFNGVVNDYLFGNVTEDDIKKMDAIPYFAASGTDMNKFLRGFAKISKAILSDPTNEENPDTMFKYLTIFATSLNGFTNDSSVLTEDNEFNQNAQVNNYSDWYMAYNSFIAPMYPICSPVAPIKPEKPEIANGTSEEERKYIEAKYELEMAEYNLAMSAYENRFKELEDLQILMITALDGPEFDNFCRVNNGLIK